jgi:diguanylate cyclase (GGDEF)-like protein
MKRRWDPVRAVAGRRTARTPADDRSARLQRLSAQIAGAAAAGSAPVPAILKQATDLLNAGYAEAMLAEEGELRLWSMRPDRPVLGPVPMNERFLLDARTPFHRGQVVRGATNAEHEFLTARGLAEAVVVPLSIDDAPGHLLVGAARDHGGFGPEAVGLLEVVANHARAALRSARTIEQLRFDSRHDALTGLPNRLYFRDLLENAAAAASPQAPVAVMVIDLNGFKAVNDSLGHAAGDELLRVLAQRFTAAIGPEAVAARLGGDEFAVLAVDVADQQAAELLAGRLTAVFDEPVTLAGTRLRFGGSVGLALGPDHGVTGADLLSRADIAMYAAKSVGATGWHLYSPRLGADSPGAEVLTLATDLREALLTGDVHIVVQPLVDLETGAVHSFEALARWDHPVMGEIAPGAFFAAAERSGLTPALSEHVLDRALAAARDWIDRGLSMRVSVNVASRWLADPALTERIGIALARHDVPADLLCLEFTELIAMADPERTQQTLTGLRAMGVHLSVDDFGTGYSSLTYLSRLPVDQIKIDESFVRQVAVSERDRAIVRSIADLGRNLGLEVVAEGVPDAVTRRTLRDLGVRFAQGYLFSPPLPAAAVPTLVSRVGVIGWSSTSMGDDVSAVRPAPAAAVPGFPVMGPRGLALPSVQPHVDTLAEWQIPTR